MRVRTEPEVRPVSAANSRNCGVVDINKDACHRGVVMKAKHVQIRQWLLFAALVVVALYLHERYPMESVVQASDEQSVDADSDATFGDAVQNPSSTPIATRRWLPSKHDEPHPSLRS